jgi:hypothetical protein
MDPAAPISPAVGPEDPTFLVPLIKRDLERLKYNTQNCSDRLEGCQCQLQNVDREVHKLTESLNGVVTGSFCLIVIFYAGSWIFSHLKVGWA